MEKIAFKIEFAFESINCNNTKNTAVYKYEAAITMLSQSFKLFHVSKIKRVTIDGTIGLSGSYYLTSYPFRNCNDHTWKDAVTRNTNNFLQAIGCTIEQHLAQSQRCD
jgi:hypothetical protein